MDRLGRLANHVLTQGCFYPLYPPSKEINIDTALWEQYAFMYRQPHILLLPSDMRHFCKWLNGCLVINPERLNKHSYARVIVRPSSDDAWTDQRVDCEILKIWFHPPFTKNTDVWIFIVCFDNKIEQFLNKRKKKFFFAGMQLFSFLRSLRTLGSKV